MTSLLDIAPLTQEVDVGGQKVEVRGVRAQDIAELLARYPQLRSLVSGRVPSTEELIAMAPGAISAVIAAGVRELGNAEVEAHVSDMAASYQADLLGAVLKLTMPDGLGPFVERLSGMMGPTPMQVVGVAGGRGKARASS